MATSPIESPQSRRAKQLREEHAMVVREKIQTTKLVDVLEKFALGVGRTKLTAPRLKAIEMLLDKSMPDLASVKHEVDSKSVTFMFATEFTPPAPEVVEPVPDMTIPAAEAPAIESDG